MGGINHEVLKEVLDQMKSNKERESMSADHYRKIIYKRDNIQTGIAFGQMIKDREITPEAYDRLCTEAKKEGFKFSFIEFVK